MEKRRIATPSHVGSSPVLASKHVEVLRYLGERCSTTGRPPIPGSSQEKKMPDQKAAWRIRTRERSANRLGSECVGCGSTENLEFDHVDPESKTVDISAAIRDGWGWSRICTELDKCQLLCADCHSTKTSTHGDGARFGSDNHRWVPARHGACKMYAKGCRCTKCRLWKKQYRAGEVDSLGRQCGGSSTG